MKGIMLLLKKLKIAVHSKVQNVENYFFNSFIINQTIDEASHLPFKQKRHEVFLNYLFDFKSRGKVDKKNNFFIFFTILNT